MKSLRGTLNRTRNVSSIEGMPRSTVGTLTHHDQEVEKLNKLWLEIIKAEEAYLKLYSESGKYSSTLKEIQAIEETFLKQLGDSNIGIHSPVFRQILDEYSSVAIEIYKNKKVGEEASQINHEAVGVGSDQYRQMYEGLDDFRKRRDSIIVEAEKSQDKLDRLKLKGKRTTDVLVEKEKLMRQFKEINTKLLAEAEKFHSLRISSLENCLEASVHNQINYYGNVTAEFNKYIQTSRRMGHVQDKQYLENINSHLREIQHLTIIDQ